MEIRILGPLEVRHENAPLALPGGRARALLAVLAIRPDTVISTDRLIDQLWGESPPPTARTKLQGLVSTLRKRLPYGGAAIRTHDPGYALAVDPGTVDAHRFRQMVEQANQSKPSEKARILRAALDSWRGPALADFVYEPFAQSEITLLEGLRQEALEERIDAELALGRHAGLVAELQHLLAEHPLRERLAGQLMLALYRSGRQAEALAIYGQTRRQLVEELGVEPGPELQQLEDRLLAQDPSLTLEPPVAEPVGAVPVWLPERRKPVTVAFVGLTAEDAVTDPEVSRNVIEEAYSTVAEAIRRHGGTMQGLLGDVAVAVFGLPTAHEDDHRRAIRAALRIRRSLAGRGTGSTEGVEVRLGINTGEVVVGDALGPPSGTTVSLAARLQQTAGAGEILVGSRTRRLLGETAVTAPTSAEEAWRLVDMVDSVTRHSPMMGRRQELSELRSAFDRVVRQNSPLLVEVVGEAGIGKSRLIRELTSQLAGRARVLAGHCPSYGEGITFWPLREMVLEAAPAREADNMSGLAGVAEISDATAAQVLGAAGLVDYPGDPRQLFGAIRDFFVALARRQPLVLIVEDLHWAEQTFRHLLSRLAHAGRGRILILCLARPEPERELELEGADLYRIELGPLGPDDIERLVRSRSGGRRLTARTLERVVERVKGNPLFAEQTAAALGDDEAVEIPPSIHALLAARLDRLGPAERDVARSASVLGSEFSIPALTALLPRQVHPFIESHVGVLEDKRMLVRSRRRFLGEPALAFSHALTQAAAYRSLTRRDRAELHERAAAWLESTGGQGTLHEVIGYHLERAHRDRIDLALDDEHSRRLAHRAGGRLAKAGLEAYAKFDMTAAENLLARAKVLLPPDHPQRHRVMRRLAETYPVMGRLDEADAAFTELLDEVGDDEAMVRSLRLERIRIRMIAGPDPMTLDDVRREAEAARAAYSSAGDETGASQACYLLSFAHIRAGRVADLERTAWEGLGHARGADLREEVGALWYVSGAMVLGPTPVEKAMAICRQLITDHGQTHGGVLSDLACLHAMQGDFQRAREMVALSHQDIVENFRGVRRALTFIAQRAARVEMMAGDLEAADRQLRWAMELAEEVGEADQVAQLAGTLARICIWRGETAEGSSLSRLSRERTPAESVMAQARWRSSTGLLRGRQGRSAEAERLGRAAVSCIPPPMLDLRAEHLCDLAEILALSGDSAGSKQASAEAAALYREKGNTVGAAAARRLT